MKPKRLGKKLFLELWRSIKPGQPIDPDPVPYKHTGSTFAEDGIRITGSRQFIESVLSRLTDMLGFENTDTRLQVSYSQAVNKDTGQPMDSWTCYIQVHMRGGEARAINNAFGKLISAGY